MELSQSIGIKIKGIREKLKLTQDELATYTSVKKSTIAKIERGAQRPPIDFLKAFSEYSNISLDELVYDKKMSSESNIKVHEDRMEEIIRLVKILDPNNDHKTVTARIIELLGMMERENSNLKDDLIAWIRKASK